MTTKTKKRAKKIKPLSEQERIDYLNNLDDLDECREAAFAFGRALLDIRKRKLFREQYKTWTQFTERCPQLRGHSRQWAYQQMDWVKGVEEMSTRVDTSDLTEYEWRCLKAIICIPDRAEVLKRLREAEMTVNEKNVEMCLREVQDAKKRKQTLAEQLELFDPEPEDDLDEEEVVLEESPDEKRLRERADEFAKERLFAPRGTDGVRIASKNWNKSNEDDWKDQALRERARQIIQTARRAFNRVERFLNKWDAQEAKAETGSAAS